MPKVYFYEKPNGEVIACGAEEAVHAASSTNKRPFRHIGTSDGVEYERIIKLERAKMGNVKARADRLRARIDSMRDGLMDLETDRDAGKKVSQVKLTKLESDLATAEANHDKLAEEANGAEAQAQKLAFAAELAIAKKNLEAPPDTSVICPNGNESLIRRQFRP